LAKDDEAQPDAKASGGGFVQPEAELQAAA
jgi:hypothetical protein